MLKSDIRSDFKCQNRISKVKFDIRPQFDCLIRISNIKIRYSAQIRMLK